MATPIPQTDLRSPLSSPAPSRLLTGAALLLALSLSGCDWLGIESASATGVRREAEGKAVGAGCRHAGRAIEDCFALNRRADKSAVFAGWREMNDYMRENKIDSVTPLLSGTGVARPGSASEKIDVEELPTKAPKAGKKDS